MGRTPRKPTAFTDEHGTACLRVRLGRGQGYAIIDEESFDRLATNGVSERWNLNASSHGQGYVKSYRKGRGGRVSIAREVLGLRKGDGLGHGTAMETCETFGAAISTPNGTGRQLKS